MQNYTYIPGFKLLFTTILVFLLTITLSAQTITTENIKNVQECFARLDQKNNFKDNLHHADMNILPMGIKQTISNMDVTIAVSGAEFYPEYTLLSAFVRIKIPEQNKTLFFGAKDIRLSHDGDIIGDARLVLLGDFEIPVSDGNVILRLKGDFNKKTGDFLDLTYATIDCKGLKGIGISAEVELSDKLCTPVDSNGEIIPNQKVIGKFQTEIAGFNDIVASVSFPTFAIKGLNDFAWTLQNAVFDFSDLKNAQGFTFPLGYDKYLIPGNEVLWRGIYVGNLMLTLPAQFSKNGEQRVSISAQHMLIDDNGISGKFGAHNILPLHEGNASGWAFSVDYFGLEIMANTIEGIQFNGLVGLPISENQTLGYTGVITPDDKYILQVQAIDTLSFDLLQAKAEIFPNSFIEFKLDKGKFRPEAMLHGRMGIDIKLDKNSKSVTQFKGVQFRGLYLKTEKPYLSVEYLGYQGDIKLLNFPVSVKEIALITNGNTAALGFDIDLTLSDGMFKGNTRLEIVGNMQEGQLQQWKFEKVNISKVFIDATVAEVFNIRGGITIMNDDPVYGDGFGGDLVLNFTEKSPLKGLSADIRGMFGYKDDYRYWFVDGIATLPNKGIPIGPSLFLNGFGGGISYKMKPNGIQGMNGNLLSATAMTYTLDKTSSLGIKASVAFLMSSDKVASGEASFELSFNDKGGLNYAGFYGYAEFLAAMPGLADFEKVAGDKYKDIIEREQNFVKGNKGLAEELKKFKQYDANKAAQITTRSTQDVGKDGFTAAVGMQFNFAESSFHATFDLYVNALGGVVAGAASGNRAGYAVIHIDPQDWYIHMGTPTDRIGLKMGVGNLANIETGSYLMVGSHIPAAPAIPPQVASILGYEPADLDYMKDLNTLGGGKGFAFGSSMSVNTGDLTFLILYANFSAGLGFDMMLKDYADAQCKGRSGAIGLDGWYANGQAYAYLHGELGVKVNLWFMKAKFPIITTDVATLMQAKLPNPSSFKAYLAARARLLGGLVNVNCRFKILIGDDCELLLPGGSPLDMRMISDLSPTDRSADISVFTAPQARFNMAIGKAFDVQDDEGEKTYRIQLKDFVLNDGNNVIGELKWNKDKDAASFYSHEVLPPKKEVKATVRVVFEQLSNGRWSSVYTAGKEAIESMTVSFNTADAPKDIPLQNMVYCYPVVDQQYFLKDESRRGYIQLQHGQSYLFPTELNNQVVYEDAKGSKQTVDFKYDSQNKRIDYSLPHVEHKSGYKLSLVSLNKGQSANDHTNSSQSLINNEDGAITVENREATAETRTDIGKVLLSYNFATSGYSSFKQKVEAIQKGKAAALKITSDVLMLEYETISMEPFDLADLAGTAQSANIPLIDVKATLDDAYYKDKIHPLIYADYPVQGTIRVKRDNVDQIGVPPAKALPLMSSYLSRLENGEKEGLLKQRFPFYYNLPAAYKADFTDLQHQVINACYTTGGTAYTRFLTGAYPLIGHGYYTINMQYVMPGGIKGTNANFDFYNFIK